MERTEVLKEGPKFDIVVLGGGFAGCAAALQAARLGKKVVIIEKSMVLGGLATLGQVNWFVAMCNGRGKLIDRGMAEEFVKVSTSLGFGGAPEEFVDGQIPEEKLEEYKAKGVLPPRYKTGFSIGLFCLQLAEMLTEAGVTIYYDTIFSDVVKNAGNEKLIDGVILENKSGRQVLYGKMFVDATGDADVIDRLGCPTVKRGGYHFMSAIATDFEHMQNAIEKENIKLAYFDTHGGTVNLYGKGPEEDLAKGTYDATNGEDINRWAVSNQIQMLNNWRKRLSEATEKEPRKCRDIVVLPGMNTLRTSRRIDGDYTLTTADEFCHFPDSIAAINDFDRRDYLYEIPLRALTRKGYGNVIAAGRIISADGYAWDFTRVIPPAILTGQAAGAVTAEALTEGTGVTDVDVTKVQKILSDANVYIHFDDQDVPEGKIEQIKEISDEK